MGANAFGQPMLRREDTRLLTGRGRFTADLVPDDALFAAFVRSPHAHADILEIDFRDALAVPGAVAAYRGEDVAAAGLGGIPAGGNLIRLPGTPADQSYVHRASRPLLAQGRVRFVGDNVAMVVAETPAAARDAAEAVAVRYATLPCVTDTKGAVADGAPLVWDAAPGNVCFNWQAGDAAAVEAGFARAARVVRLELVNNRVHVAALETRGGVGSFDRATGRSTLATGTQMPHGIRHELAAGVLRVPESDVRVLVADVGGSFGIKNALYPEQALVLWAARNLGRAVAWIGERGDGFVSDYQARDNVSVGELALDAEGRFLALRVSTVAAVGAYLAPAGQLSPTANTPALAGVYRLPAIHVAVTGAYSHTAPTEVYRGAGRPEAVHLLERLVDHAAREIGMDRLELRRCNLLTAAELPYQTALGLRYDSGDFPAMLDAATARAAWESFGARRDAAAAKGMLRGIGLAHYCERVAGSWAENGWLELRPDGKVTVLTGTMSNGQGHETAFAQLVAAELGLDPGDVEVVQGDTDRIPSGHGTGGSASLAIGGAALANAAVDLMRQVLPLAADALEAAVADVTFEDGLFRIVGTDRAIGLRQVAGRLGQGDVPALLAGAGFYQPSGPTFPNGCHVAEVEIDPETGEWRLERYTMLHDFGRVLNPMLLEGQLQGGVVQGIGQAAYERVVHEAGSGQVLTGSFMDYQIPRADDLPALSLETLATPSPSHPLGVKGCGEAGAAGAPPAVMNALMDALATRGVTALDMPATPARVWEALRAGG